MRKVGKVTVELLDGKPYGPRALTIGNWVGKAYYSPKENLSELFEKDESAKPGVYCLRYFDQNTCCETIYIGEADNIRDRLSTHFKDPKKSSFTDLMFFVSLNDWLTKTQIKYLEHRLIVKALTVNARTNNKVAPSRPNIHAAEENDLEDFLDYMILLLHIMGFRFMLPQPEEYQGAIEIGSTAINWGILETEGLENRNTVEPKKPRSIQTPQLSPKRRKNWAPLANKTIQGQGLEQILKFTIPAGTKIPALHEIPIKNPEPQGSEDNGKGKGSDKPIRPNPTPPKPAENTPFPAPEGKYRIVDKQLNARMDKDGDKFIVKKGSQARKTLSNSISPNYITLRNELIKKRILVDDGEYLRFTVDYPFTSPSAASNMVLGRQSPGPRMWVDEDNRSLRGIINDPTG